jgi:Flp pilus assembly protein TadG
MVHRTRRLERGAAAVEMAIILPLLVLLLGGMVDYGRFFFTQIQLTNAAREGARAAIVGGDPVMRATAAGGTTPGWVSMTLASNVLPTTGCGGSTPDKVKVTTKAQFQFFFVGVLPGVPSSTTISADATMGCV